MVRPLVLGWAQHGIGCRCPVVKRWVDVGKLVPVSGGCVGRAGLGHTVEGHSGSLQELGQAFRRTSGWLACPVALCWAAGLGCR